MELIIQKMPSSHCGSISTCGDSTQKNARPWKEIKAHSQERNELLRTVKRLGRTLWKKMVGLSSAKFG